MAAPAVAPAALKRTPLYDLHRSLGAKLIDFGGWEMPVQYAGILEEHRAVREAVGLFDLSHMGELAVSGPDALVDIRGRAAKARVVPTPFSKRSSPE
jgi:glycine cleavage system aminomethyltransferase T